MKFGIKSSSLSSSQSSSRRIGIGARKPTCASWRVIALIASSLIITTTTIKLHKELSHIPSDHGGDDMVDKTTHGLRAIITGLEHSGTTLAGSVLYNTPCVIGAFETGYLIAETPEVIDKVNPWFGWNMASLTLTLSHINYRLKDEDIETMKKAENFMEMYDILRHRSYLFNNLTDEEYCDKPYQMIDKTPKYVHPAYFESVLQKTPGVPVVVLQKNFEKLIESWDVRGSTLTQQFYNEVFDNVWKMKLKYKGRILIIHTEDLMAHPEATMQDIFEHVGLEFQTEYLQMEGLLKKISNDIRTRKSIEQMKFKAGKHSTDREVLLGNNITNKTG